MLLAMIMLGSAFSGCSKDEVNPSVPVDGKENINDGGGETAEEKSVILTGIYKGAALQLEEDERIVTEIKPYIDRDAGKITFITTRYESKEETDENGEIQYTGVSHYYVVKADMEMNILDKTELDFGENSYLNKGALTGEYLYYNTESYDNTGMPAQVFLNRMSLETGEVKTSTPLNDMFEAQEDRPWFSVEYLVTDSDGNVYLAQSREIVVLNSDFIKQYSIQLNDWTSFVASSPDGRVFVTQRTDGGEGLFEIDKTAHRLTDEPIYSSESSIGNVLFGDGYDFYFSNKTGLYGQTGEGEPELVMNYLNSNVNPDDFRILAVIDRDSILANESKHTASGYVNITSVYKSSGEVDLSEVQVIEIAVMTNSGSIDRDMNTLTVEYNKEHNDRRINITNYSEYSDGATRLGTDIANGLYKPDIVLLDSNNGAPIRDYIIENNLFVDYNEILADKPEVLEDMFGGAERALSTPDGRMWGMAREFRVNTILTSDPALMDKASWTLEEMLDYRDTLSGDKVLIDGQYREAFTTTEESFYYDSFVDMEKYTCDFENETFYRLLDFIISLPTEEEYRQQADASYDSGNRYAKCHEGKVALFATDFNDVISWMYSQVVFNTTEYNPIGYPTETGYGSMAQPSNTYMITKWCENPEWAWEFIEKLVRIDIYGDSGAGRYIRWIPVFKSLYNAMCEEYSDDSYVFRFHYDGSSGWGNSRGTLEEVKASLEKPGIVTLFDKEAAEKYADFLDNRVGGAMVSSIPAEVMGIIGEEVSSYAAGVNGAESCAGKIQSRVAIWLSEHEK